MNVKKWSVDDVANWLASIGLEEYKKTFISNAISGEELLELTAADLDFMNLKKLGHKKRILREISNLSKNMQPPKTRKVPTMNAAHSFRKDVPFKVIDETTNEIQVFLWTCPQITIENLRGKINEEFGMNKMVKMKVCDRDGDWVELQNTEQLLFFLKTRDTFVKIKLV